MPTPYYSREESDLMFKSIDDKLESILKEQRQLREDMKPLLEAYDGLVFGKKIIIGLASILAALAAIGAAVMWLLGYIRHG